MDQISDSSKIPNGDNVVSFDQAESGLIGAVAIAIRISFGIFLFCSAFSIAASQLALGLSVLFFVVLLVNRRREMSPVLPRPVWLAVVAYLVWLIVSALAGPTPLESVASIREEWLFLAVPVALFLFRDRKTSDHLVTALAAGLLLVAVYGLVQHFTGAHWFRAAPLTPAGQFFRPNGNFSHPLTYGNYVVAAALFIVGYGLARRPALNGWRWIGLVLAGLAGLIIVPLSGSRGPMLAAAAGVLALSYLLRRLRYFLPVTLVLILVGWVFSTGFSSSMSTRTERDLTPDHPLSRLYIWKNSLAIIAEHPLTGVGPGNFCDEYERKLPEGEPRQYPITHAHSDYLNLAVTVGIPGLILYLMIWYAVGRDVLRTYREGKRKSNRSRAFSLGTLAASAAFLVASLTEAAFADEEVRQLMMAIWGMGLSAGIDSSDSTAERIADDA